jgi:hypothetical protein
MTVRLNRIQKKTAVIFGIATLLAILISQAMFRSIAVGGNPAVAWSITLLLAGVAIGLGGWLLLLQRGFALLSVRQQRDLVSHLRSMGYDLDLCKRVVRGINWFQGHSLRWQSGTIAEDFDVFSPWNCVLAKATGLDYSAAKKKHGLTRPNVCHDLAFAGLEETTKAWRAAGKYCLEHGLV